MFSDSEIVIRNGLQSFEDFVVHCPFSVVYSVKGDMTCRTFMIHIMYNLYNPCSWPMFWLVSIR